jgi:hypothetical protein
MTPPTDPLTTVLAKLEELGQKFDTIDHKTDETNIKIEEMKQSVQQIQHQQSSVTTWKPELEGKVTDSLSEKTSFWACVRELRESSIYPCSKQQQWIDMTYVSEAPYRFLMMNTTAVISSSWFTANCRVPVDSPMQ